jgi:adenosylmethionine-8-amino-7-oxononanoate aminotransferase
MSTLSERDLRVLWHPCTQMHDHLDLPMISIARGEGAWLIGHDGHRYLDAISSWWTNLFGHCQPQIAAAIAQQAQTLEHVLLAGFTHEPAVQLAETLLAHAPAGLAKVFFADNGSAATEVALKMSLHYWRNLGQPQRQRLIALDNCYHGETIGALSVSDVGLYREPYAPLLFEPLLAPVPDSFNRAAGQSAQDHVQVCLDRLAQLLDQHGTQVAAMIVEPLVQCAGGMRMYPPEYLIGVRRLCDQHGIHLIADEIAVGMGRTGRQWGVDHAAITPDFLLTSKGLTGGFLPLSAVLTTEQIYDAFYAEYQTRRAFLHSHSYTGNPLACAAALATFKLIDQSDFWTAQSLRVAQLQAALAPLREHPQIGEVRQTGLIAAAEMVAERSSRRTYDWTERRGLRVYRHGLEHGVLLRPLGNVIYFLPPYCVEPAELQLMVRVALEGIHRATR